MLKTVPWNNVDINLLGVEVAHAGEVFDGSTEEIRNFLEGHGFIYKVPRAICLNYTSNHLKKAEKGTHGNNFNFYLLFFRKTPAMTGFSPRS